MEEKAKSVATLPEKIQRKNRERERSRVVAYPGLEI
jgi:hypothetical protein